MQHPQPVGWKLEEILTDIRRGIIKIPQFQRDFVWKKDKTAKLLDSLIKGYPIGTFIFWKTKEVLRTVRNIGGANLPETPEGDFIQYVLDGQQRITSIFAALEGLCVPREGRTDDFGDIFLDLEAAGDEDIVVIHVTDKDPSRYCRLKDLIGDLFTVIKAVPGIHHDKLQDYRDSIKGSVFSVILVKEAPLEVATDIFTRINEGGRPLTVFEIMVAKTFDPDAKFDLAEKVSDLQDTLREVSYETVPNSVVLQAVSAILTKECRKKTILSLDKAKFIERWPSVVNAIEHSVEYFRNAFRIPVSRLLPYASLLVPFAYFFYNQPTRPTASQARWLQDLFFRTSLGGRYSGALETSIAQDVKRMDQILNDQRPSYDYEVDIGPDFIRLNGAFSSNRSYIKAILCVLAHQEPKSFSDNAMVRLSNDWLKRINSRNYHHFFPKAYLKKNGYPIEEVNHIANITIVDEYLNKRDMRDKRPSQYMRAFQKQNPKLTQTMGSHLIGDFNEFGVWEDDYEKFFAKRCEAIARELAERVIPQPADKVGREEQRVAIDDEDPLLDEEQAS